MLGNGKGSSLLYDRWMSDTSDTLSSHFTDNSLLSHIDHSSVSDVVCNDQCALRDHI